MMPAGYLVIRVPSGFDVHRMIFNPRMGLFTCNGRHNRLMTEFIEDDSIRIDSDSEYLGTILSEYDAELSKLRDELDVKAQINGALENELAEERASSSIAQRRLKELDLTNQDLCERLSKDKGWSIGHRKEQTRTVSELLSRIDEYEKLLEQSRQSNHKLSKKLDQALSKNDELTEESKNLRRKLDGLRELYEKNIREATILKADFKEQHKRIADLTQNLEDLEKTNRHLRNEKNDMTKVDVRGIISGFLQFTTDVHNALQDRQDDDLKNYLLMRNEYLKMNMKGVGLEIVHHQRGQDLSDVRVDIQPVDTNNPDLNGKVKISDRFGCRFSSTYYPDIPEAVTVYSLDGGQNDNTSRTENAPENPEPMMNTSEKQLGESGTVESAEIKEAN